MVGAVKEFVQALRAQSRISNCRGMCVISAGPLKRPPADRALAWSDDEEAPTRAYLKSFSATPPYLPNESSLWSECRTRNCST
ncbi:hypothetical protein Y032_0011g1269 [Ancylostoma ceylanicum]|uniref:Uncharacterized protein n=1 Tax=Ancylostoma ceylanicum TaxID=53326 RepID=A0A016VEX6_9BILA|nr:hypothetical protein Y032_0011g1269 [Ancylostoma ceylanicum]